MKVPGHPFEYTAKEIPVRAFYRAVHGFGSGEGASASIERFTELLRTKRIVQIQATPVGQPERVILNQLVLDDGTRLHFDSSSRGACCYYIEESGPSCVEVVDNELSTDATAEVGNQNREKDRRIVKALGELGDKARSIASSAPPLKQPSAGGMPSMPEANNVQTSGTSRDGSADFDQDMRV
jgi:hypothetical protein